MALVDVWVAVAVVYASNIHRERAPYPVSHIVPDDFCLEAE